MNPIRDFVIRPLVAAALIAGCALTIRHFWGESNITSSFDGEPIGGAIVYVNGKKVGETPYKATLPIGNISIRVHAPDGYEANPASVIQHRLTLARGADLNVNFEPAPYEYEISAEPIGSE